jgi:uncharacterized membrane protein YoaK (UPF0700 family)
MHTLNRHVFFLAFCLSALAGCVDAIGFLELGGHFVSFMSGNSTRLSVSLAGGDHQAALYMHFGFMGMWVPVAWGSALTIACLLLRRRLVF